MHDDGILILRLFSNVHVKQYFVMEMRKDAYLSHTIAARLATIGTLAVVATPVVGDRLRGNFVESRREELDGTRVNAGLKGKSRGSLAKAIRTGLALGCESTDEGFIVFLYAFSKFLIFPFTLFLYVPRDRCKNRNVVYSMTMQTCYTGNTQEEQKPKKLRTKQLGTDMCHMDSHITLLVTLLGKVSVHRICCGNRQTTESPSSYGNRPEYKEWASIEQIITPWCQHRQICPETTNDETGRCAWTVYFDYCKTKKRGTDQRASHISTCFVPPIPSVPHSGEASRPTDGHTPLLMVSPQKLNKFRDSMGAFHWFRSEGHNPLSFPPPHVKNIMEGDFFFYWVKSVGKCQIWIWKSVSVASTWVPAREGEQFMCRDGTMRYLVITDVPYVYDTSNDNGYALFPPNAVQPDLQMYYDGKCCWWAAQY
ncbi:hypothetical protein EDC04DRAFT_2601928 [Pisolithus marmoratus]|nr:hypothetical protein EDC04DRAFT_2601928 [Pisolithus marmoratus]